MYTKRNDIPNLQPGEAAVELETGDLVAVGCEVRRCQASQCAVFDAHARAITPDGITRADAQGKPVRVGARHSLSDHEIETLGQPAALRECLLLVLGEPLTPVQGADPLPDGTALTLIPFSPQLRASASIRRALATAAMTGPAQDVGAVL